jgi:Fe-S cluster assembly protein SufD
MEKLRVNDTPVRTARNFLINNIEIELDIPEKIAEFKNIEIINDKSIIDKQTSNKPLIYGNGKILEKLNYETANNKIRIQTNSKNENVKIIYNFDDNNLNLINQIEIIANNDANVTIVYKSNTLNKCLHNGIIKTIVNENAKLNINIVNLLNEKSDNFEAMENTLEANSKLKYTIIDIGGRTSVSNYYSNIIGENADNDLKSIYLGIDNQRKDINYIAELRGIKTNIDIDVQGALQDSAKKNFKGTIDFKKGCKKAKGNENEYCMLLSDKAKSIALPMLLCTEDNVEGNHSTASGKIDNNQLFYIMSRGLSYKEAVKLIVKANFNKIIERITDEELKNEVLNEIDNKLN